MSAALLDDLRTLVRTDRINWQLPMQAALSGAGASDTLTAAGWAALPWYGVLELWRHDPAVSDILVNGPEREIYLVQQGRRIPTRVRAHAQWITFAQRQLGLRAGQLDAAAPEQWQVWGQAAHVLEGTADRRLRFACTRPPATPDGPTIAVRLLPERWRSLHDLVLDGVVTAAVADLLLAALRAGVSILLGGATGSGKTTVAAALLGELADEARLVIVEQSRELPATPDSVAIEAGGGAIRFVDAVRLALRQKPTLIVVGEVRGAEALALLRAAATGHPGVATIHANDAQSALKNLERMASEGGEVAPGIVRGMLTSSAAPLVVGQIAVVDGRRRLVELVEVLPSGAAGQLGDRFTTQALFAYDGRTQQIVRQYPVQGAWARGRF
jgi:Flp pilus assembly CpaF family ATPase